MRLRDLADELFEELACVEEVVLVALLDDGDGVAEAFDANGRGVDTCCDAGEALDAAALVEVERAGDADDAVTGEVLAVVVRILKALLFELAQVHRGRVGGGVDGEGDLIGGGVGRGHQQGGKGEAFEHGDRGEGTS